MGEIVHNIDWTIYKEWYSSCKPLLEANKRSQRTSIPNLHHVLLDTMLILDDLVKLSNSVEVVDDIRNWARQMIMGYCHKALRVLEPVHYAAFMLNPGTGYIPDLSNIIPYGEE